MAIDTLIVDTLEDENDGIDVGGVSLRDALATIDPGGTIAFADTLAGETISLANSELVIDRAVTLDGGSNNITVDAAGQSRVLNINDGEESAIAVFISGLTISGGDVSGIALGGGIANFENLSLSNSTISGNAASGGGGVYNAASSILSLSDSTISGNSALLSGAGILSNGSTVTLNNSTVGNNFATGEYGAGGGIFNTASILTASNSTISGNSASLFGGGIVNADSMLTLENSTVGDNSAPLSGGGIVNSFAGVLTLRNSTVSGNAATGVESNGGGILNFYDSTTDLVSTIIAGNTASLNPDINADGTIAATDSLIQMGNGAIAGGVDGNIVGLDPLLDPDGLQDNGGPTETIALQPDSPAIDAGSNPNSLVTDQRGPGFPRVLGAATDIGAFEAMATLDTPVDEPVDDAPPANVAPVFTSVDTVEVLEGTTAVLAVTATDADSDALEFAISGGADQDAFVLDPITNILTFQIPPDFEVPSDADGNNVFEVEISVTDGSNDPVVQPLAVSVIDDLVAEPIAAVNLNVDGSDEIVPSVDVLNIFRVLAGAPQAVVIPAGLDISQQDISDAVNTLGLALDVDGSGEVVPSVDVLNIFRVLAGAPQAVAIPAGLDISQQEISDAVNALIT